MTAPEKAMWLIVNQALENANETPIPYPQDNIKEVYDKMDNDKIYGCYIQDARDEVREGDSETDLDAPFSRNYECDNVASRLPDGTWIAYPYWYGGGKFGNPEEIEWIEDSFDVEYEEEVVTIKKFSKIKPCN